MSPKPKKQDEEPPPPPPEECLPPEYSIGCAVYWVDETKQFENGDVVEIGLRGALTAVVDVTDFEEDDGTKGYLVETVTVQFDGVGDAHTVPFKCISAEPAPLDLMGMLSTGIQLPLRGKRVEEFWAAQGDFERQARLLEESLGLEQVFPAPAQREIVTDFHIFNLAQAKSLCLNTVQAAVFLAIMDQILQMTLDRGGNPAAKPHEMCSAAACFKEFERLILMHAMDTPGCLRIFQDSEVRLLTDFVSTTFFKHFLLYRYCINFDREVEVLRFSMGVERPLPPPELSTGKQKPRKPAEPPAYQGRELAQPEAPFEEEEVTEEEEIERLVQEKLKETEARLQAKLDEREEAFRAKAAEAAEANSAGKKKGKK